MPRIDHLGQASSNSIRTPLYPFTKVLSRTAVTAVATAIEWVAQTGGVAPDQVDLERLDLLVADDLVAHRAKRGVDAIDHLAGSDLFLEKAAAGYAPLDGAGIERHRPLAAPMETISPTVRLEPSSTTAVLDSTNALSTIDRLGHDSQQPVLSLGSRCGIGRRVRRLTQRARSGMVKFTVVPSSGELIAVMEPPWASTRSRAIVRPRPVPVESADLTNRSKTWGRASGWIPVPSSRTDTRTPAGLVATSTMTALRRGVPQRIDHQVDHDLSDPNGIELDLGQIGSRVHRHRNPRILGLGQQRSDGVLD